MKFIVYCFIALSLFSCESNKSLVYEHLIIDENEINLWYDTISYSDRQQYEEGFFILRNQEDNILEKGSYYQGMKDGAWVYKNLEEPIYWKQFEDSVSKIFTIYPTDWKISYENDKLFQAILPYDTVSNVDEYFVVLSYNKKKHKLDLYKYENLYNEVINTKNTVIANVNYKFSKGERDYFYNEYTVVRNEVLLNVFSFIGEDDCCVYDLSLVVKKDQEKKNRIVFFDIIKNIKINGLRFFSPYEKTYFEKFNAFIDTKPQA